MTHKTVGCPFGKLYFYYGRTEELIIISVVLRIWIFSKKYVLRERKTNSPVDLSRRISRLILYRGVRATPAKRALDMTLNNLMVRFQ